MEKLKRIGKKALIPDVDRKNVTIYMQRWDGFKKTWINESFSPDDILNFFSDYLSTFTSSINHHNGEILSVNESDIVALFGTDNNSENVDNASLCALECLEQIHIFSDRWSQDNDLFNLAIGIDAGSVIMGNFGSSNSLYFNVLGQPVKSAAFLVQQIVHGSRILISEFAQKELNPRFELKDLDKLVIKGLRDPVKLYELTGYN